MKRDAALPPVGPARCDHCGGTPASRESDDMRCGCGNLLARITANGLEVKCRRCKRTVLLPIAKEVGTSA